MKKLGWIARTMLKWHGSGHECTPLPEWWKEFIQEHQMFQDGYVVHKGRIYKEKELCRCDKCHKLVPENELSNVITELNEMPPGYTSNPGAKKTSKYCRECKSRNCTSHDGTMYLNSILMEVVGLGLIPEWYVNSRMGRDFFLWTRDGAIHYGREPAPPEDRPAGYHSEHRPWIRKEFIKTDSKGKKIVRVGIDDRPVFVPGAMSRSKPRVVTLDPPSIHQMVFGVELEILCKSDKKDSVKTVCNLARKHGLLAEHDGSLNRDYGVEIVGPPFPMEDYSKTDDKGEFNGVWATFLKSILGYANGWKAGTGYGMHISINATALTEAQKGKFNYFINSSRALCETIAGRPESSYAKFMNRSLAKHARANGDKYQAAGMTPKSSSARNERIEVRIFRSTILYERMLRNVQFCDSVVQYIRQCSISQSGRYTEYLGWLMQNHFFWPHLCKFLVEKKMATAPVTRTKLTKLTVAQDTNET